MTSNFGKLLLYLLLFINIHFTGSMVKATKLSAVAMREGTSDIIEVRLGNPQDHLQVLQNQTSLSFSEQSWMDLKGETLDFFN